VVFIVALVASVGTLAYMLRLGTGVFWGTPKGSRDDDEVPSDVTIGPIRVGAAGTTIEIAAAVEAPIITKWRPLLVFPGLALALLSLAIGLFPEWLLALADTAGHSLADPAAYVSAVLEGRST
jgi:formate hydrogenlyase subunit 3/multisubunit Na+/H+ antiporter MnhD subunit